MMIVERTNRPVFISMLLAGWMTLACAGEPQKVRLAADETETDEAQIEGGAEQSSASSEPMDPDALYEAATRAFFMGRIEDSLEHFDALYALMPDRSKGQLWQRGIALYYAARFEDCVEQFEQHRTVNPHDVENSVWHYLCYVPLVGKQRAQAAFFPARDGRVPMMEVHALYSGAASEEVVLRRARAESVQSGAQRVSLFYAHLYLALWHESEGRHQAVKENLALALQGPAVGHYMYGVAEMHQKWLETKNTD